MRIWQRFMCFSLEFAIRLTENMDFLLSLEFSLYIQIFPTNLNLVFHWSLSDNESLEISRTLLSNLADLNSAVVWSTFSQIVFSRLLENVPRAPTTIDITNTFMLYMVLLLSDEIQIICFLLFSLNGLLERQNPEDDKFLFFSLISTKYGFLVLLNLIKNNYKRRQIQVFINYPPSNS